MMSETGGYPLKASRCGSISTSVATMKTANTARRTTTISDWARSTKRSPIRLIATIATMITEVKTLSQPAAASFPMKSEVA